MTLKAVLKSSDCYGIDNAMIQNHEEITKQKVLGQVFDNTG